MICAAVVKSTAAQLNLAGIMNIPNQSHLHPNEFSPQCVVLARNQQCLEPLLAQGWVAFGKGDGLNDSAPWTDDYINILAPLMANLWPHHAQIVSLEKSASRADPNR